MLLLSVEKVDVTCKDRVVYGDLGLAFLEKVENFVELFLTVLENW